MESQVEIKGSYELEQNMLVALLLRWILKLIFVFQDVIVQSTLNSLFSE